MVEQIGEWNERSRSWKGEWLGSIPRLTTSSPEIPGLLKCSGTVLIVHAA